MAGHHLVHVQLLQHIDHPCIADPAVRQHKVLAQCSLKELCVLTHVTKTAAQFCRLNLLDIDRIDADMPGLWCVQACQQAQQGALSAANATQQAQMFTGLQMHGQLADDWPWVFARIGKFQFVGLQIACDLFRDHIASCPMAVTGPFHQGVERVQGTACLLEARRQRHDAAQW